MQRKEQYHKFLNSGWWKRIRKHRLKKDKICFICREKHNLHIHHYSYKNTYKGKISLAMKDTLVLCKDCHLLVHSIQKEKNKSFEDTLQIAMELQTEHNRARRMYFDSIDEFSALVKNF